MGAQIGPIVGRRRGWYAVGLIVSAGAGVLFALSCLGGAVGAAGSASQRARSGETFGGDIALALVSAVIVAACIALSVHFEHQLRRHHPIARAWAAPAPAGVVPAMRAWPGRRGRRYSPGVMVFQILVFTAMFVGFVVGAVVSHSHGQRSSLVQHHGIARSATVLSVKNTYHSSRGGGYYTANAAVSFSPAYDGQTESVVHYPGRLTAQDGSRYSVLVDPNDPGYAEFPGAPSAQSWTWMLLLAFALFAAALDVLFARTWMRLRRHRRSISLP